MTCPNCDPKLDHPGRLIKASADTTRCAVCGDQLSTHQRWNPHNLTRWDSYFHTICNAVSSKSSCLSRQIGSILVRDKSVVATGYNGPARGYPHCPGPKCPRQLKPNYKSGEDLVSCPAVHAEANCIANAARNGVSTLGCSLYLNTIIPCKDCMILLVNSGIIEVICTDLTYYHQMSEGIASSGGIRIRRFELDGKGKE